jgi:energy-coupling factor transport system permease protein
VITYDSSMANFHDAHTGRSPRDQRVFVADDPRVLIIVFFLIIFSTFLIRHTIGLLCIFLYVAVLDRFSGRTFGGFIRITRNIAPFALLIVVINAFLVKGHPLTSEISFLSREGFFSGIFYSVRLLVLYHTAVVFLSVSSQETMAKGLSALLRPVSPSLASRIALYGFLSIGFLPLFADEVERVRVAQRFRGGGLEGGPLQKLRGVRLLLVPIIVSAVHRSAQLAMAVELRGIKSSIGQLLILTRASTKDYVFAAVSGAILLVAVFIL